MNACARDGARQRGFALVIVLWAAMILAAILASIVATGRSETRLAHTHYAIARADAADDAAIDIALLRMLAPPPAVPPPVDARPFTVAFGGRAVIVRVQDETGKIDLNLAERGLLRRLLVVAGLGADQADGLADKILDWREGGFGRRLNGAKAADYRDAGFAYGPRDGPFEAVAELQLVMGMTQTLYRRLEPSLTVYSRTPWVDPSFAPRDVLEALATMGGPAVSAFLAARAAAAPGAVMLGHAFTIEAEARDAGGLRVARRAVIRLTGSPRAPFAVYRWQ